MLGLLPLSDRKWFMWAPSVCIYMYSLHPYVIYFCHLFTLSIWVLLLQTQLCELREESAELHSQKLMSDSMINQLKMEMTDNSKETEIEKLKEELEKVCFKSQEL